MARNVQRRPVCFPLAVVPTSALRIPRHPTPTLCSCVTLYPHPHHPHPSTPGRSPSPHPPPPALKPQPHLSSHMSAVGTHANSAPSPTRMNQPRPWAGGGGEGRCRQPAWVERGCGHSGPGVRVPCGCRVAVMCHGHRRAGGACSSGGDQGCKDLRAGRSGTRDSACWVTGWGLRIACSGQPGLPTVCSNCCAHLRKRRWAWGAGCVVLCGTGPGGARLEGWATWIHVS